VHHALHVVQQAMHHSGILLSLNPLVLKCSQQAHNVQIKIPGSNILRVNSVTPIKLKFMLFIWITFLTFTLKKCSMARHMCTSMSFSVKLHVVGQRSFPNYSQPFPAVCCGVQWRKQFTRTQVLVTFKPKYNFRCIQLAYTEYTMMLLMCQQWISKHMKQIIEDFTLHWSGTHYRKKFKNFMTQYFSEQFTVIQVLKLFNDCHFRRESSLQLLQNPSLGTHISHLHHVYSLKNFTLSDTFQNYIHLSLLHDVWTLLHPCNLLFQYSYTMLFYFQLLSFNLLLYSRS
jgi:hypothetical protein